MDFEPRFCRAGKYPGIASDRGQNRSLYFVSSELLNPVENCSSCRRVLRFVIIQHSRKS